MFNLIQRAPAGGDCTAPYDVIFDKEYTIEEFVADVLSRRDEWGSIFIYDRSSKSGYKSCGRNYKYGELSMDLPKKLIGKKVKFASAHGGWSLMNYDIELR